MIIYRPHRGSLDDAMKEWKEFSSFDEMKNFLSEESRFLTGEPLYFPHEITIGQNTINDYRIGWADCRHVLVSRMGGERYPFPQCIGWCATQYKKPGE